MTFDETERFFDRLLSLAEDLGLESTHEKLVMAGLHFGELYADDAFDRRERHAEGWFKEAVVGALRCSLRLDARGEVLFSTWALAGFRLRTSRLMAGSIGAGS